MAAEPLLKNVGADRADFFRLVYTLRYSFLSLPGMRLGARYRTRMNLW